MGNEADWNTTADTVRDVGTGRRKVWRTPKVILSEAANAKGGAPADNSDGVHSATVS
jgi:hypothetical protein